MNPLVERLGWTLVHSLWEGTLAWAGLKLALIALRRRSAQARYLAGCGALGIAILAPWITFLNLHVGAASGLTPAAVIKIAPNPGVAVAGWTGSAASGSYAWLGHLEHDLTTAFPWLVLAWVIGCAWASMRLMLDWRATRRLAAAPCQPLSEPIHQRCMALVTMLGISRAVRFGESLLVEVPSVVGWLKPVILIPAGAFMGLSPSQIDAVLGHELAHVLRHDFLVNLLQSICDVAFFYHPAMLAINSRIRLERENACDDIAVALTGDQFGYAAALARLEEARHSTLSLAATGNGNLLGRIRRLLGRSPPKERPAPTAAWMAFAGLCLYLAAVLITPSVVAQLSTNGQSGAAKQAVTGLTRPTGPRDTTALIAHPSSYNFEAMAALQYIPSRIVVNRNGSIPTDIYSQVDLNTFEQILRSNKLRRRVIASYSPAELELLQPTHSNAGDGADIFGTTTSEYDSANFVVYIFSKHPNPAAAALIANRYASQFLATLQEITANQIDFAVKFLRKRGDDLRQESEAADKAFESFKIEHGGDDAAPMNGPTRAQRDLLEKQAEAAKLNYNQLLLQLKQTEDNASRIRIPLRQIVTASGPKD